jgi:23S rRNA pseudouridine2605 synthase
VRLQKVLAQAGVASRRAAEELIAEGRVSVDGALVTAQGTRVDPETAVVRVDGDRIPTAAGKSYYALNKPAGVITAMSDPRGRRCVGDLVAGREERLFHVGRLDAETEGLLILTNDGALAHRLSHPSFGVAKVYLAQVPGPVPKEVGRRLLGGVELDDGPARVDAFRVVAQSGRQAQVEVTLHEGRNHIVRRLLAAVGLPVERLVRLQFGPIRLGQQRSGTVRPLGRTEVGLLLDTVDLTTSG